MKAKPSKEFDFITSLASADTFHNVAKGCLYEYKKINKISPTLVFASATNYGLSLELYLKTLIIMEGNNKPHGHDLYALYNKLSEKTRKELNKKYKEIDGEIRKDTLYIRAALENSEPNNANNNPIKGTKLKQIFNNNKNIFVMYRYMFEKGRTKEWEYFYFEYGNFDLVCQSLKLISNNMLNENEKLKVNNL
jgi:HEPN domain-containing protein